jgi:hypothetical protein
MGALRSVLKYKGKNRNVLITILKKVNGSILGLQGS